MSLTAIGKSSYHDFTRTSPHGKMQYLQPEAGRQAVAMFNAVNKAAGYVTKDTPRFTANEGQRPQARCDELYAGYVARRYAPPKVAYPYSSNHFPGLAIDIGITMPDGSNRAMTGSERALLGNVMEDFGYLPDGLSFGEQWHVGYHGRPKYIAPVGIKLDTVPKPAKKPTAPVVVTSEDEEMALVKITGGTYKGVSLSVTAASVSRPSSSSSSSSDFLPAWAKKLFGSRSRVAVVDNDNSLAALLAHFGWGTNIGKLIPGYEETLRWDGTTVVVLDKNLKKIGTRA